jgi:site-specific recombinase
MSSRIHEALRRFADCAPDAPAPATMRLRDDLMAVPGPPAACIEVVAATLRDDAALLEAFAGALGALLARVRHRFLYAETGVLEPLSFARTLRSRLGEKVLPHVVDPQLLRDLFASAFSSRAAMSWVQEVPVECWAAWFALVLDSPAFADGAAHARRECDAAVAMLAARAAGLAVDPDRVRYDHAVRGAQASNEGDVLDLPAAAQAWAAARSADPAARPRDLLRRLATAVEEVQTLRAAAPSRGTSVALSHSLHAALQTLGRLRELVLIRAADGSAERSQRAAALFVELVAAQRTEHSLGQVFSHVADEISHRVTEHASQTGEHYVTDDRPQWWAMLRAAAGAGAIVAFMALLKILVVRAHVPPLWETLAVCLNYGFGFVLIHLLHFTVATKQPAMTATLLAARLGQEEATPAGAARLADLIVRTVRTQVVAIVGNVALAVPTAIAIFFAWQALVHASPVPEPKVRQLLEELHPWRSWALLHAAIAGGCLFVAGVISGYYDNLCIYGRVGERLAHHPALLRVLGPGRAARLAAYIQDNLGALLGNLAFGFMLGGIGFLGALTGLPIDIRHVAFASANTAYALSSLAARDSEMAIATIAIVGVVLVGAVNVTVAFGLAFATAFRARKVRYERAELVIRLVLKRFLRRPHDFVWPPAAPRSSEAADPTAPGDRG